jgi:hypothetical protein
LRSAQLSASDTDRQYFLHSIIDPPRAAVGTGLHTRALAIFTVIQFTFLTINYPLPACPYKCGVRIA